jgi:predicted nucleic acid-binding protein
MLCDAGPLVAIIDHSDKNHQRCLKVLSTLRSALLTTWPCFTEAMYLLGQYGGQPAQNELWSYVEDGIVTFHISSEPEQKRMRVLMRKYRDTPMDLADASLVAAAEVLNQID